MGMMTYFKIQKAINLQSKGKEEEALAIYRECWKEGMEDPRGILAYAVLLLRCGEYRQAREILVKSQNNSLMNAEQKLQLYIDYAACVFRMGEVDKAVQVLESQKSMSGLMYNTLGYLYVEQLDLSRKPDADTYMQMEKEKKKEKPQTTEAVQFPDVSAILNAENNEKANDSVSEEAEDLRTPEERRDEWWNARIEKARHYLEEAVEYDDEDSITLDNMGQFLYRVIGDKEAAREWFIKANKIKPLQKDTLWFLSRYDLDEGNPAAAVEKLNDIKKSRFSPLNFVTADLIDGELKRLEAL